MKPADHDTVTALTLAELEGRTALVFGSNMGNIRIWDLNLERREASGHGLTTLGKRCDGTISWCIVLVRQRLSAFQDGCLVALNPVFLNLAGGYFRHAQVSGITQGGMEREQHIVVEAVPMPI